MYQKQTAFFRSKIPPSYVGSSLHNLHTLFWNFEKWKLCSTIYLHVNHPRKKRNPKIRNAVPMFSRIKIHRIWPIFLSSILDKCVLERFIVDFKRTWPMYSIVYNIQITNKTYWKIQVERKERICLTYSSIQLSSKSGHGIPDFWISFFSDMIWV